MSVSAPVAVALALGAGLTLLLVTRGSRTSKPSNTTYAPGPPAAPLVGNLLQLPVEDGWFKMTEWKQQYGDVIYLHGLGKSILVLNSMKAIEDLLIKGGINYSNRPNLVVVGELFGGNNTMALKSHNEGFVLQRKLTHAAFGAEAVKKYIPMQEDMAATFAAKLIDDPKHFREHIQRASGRLILRITYGIPAKLADEQFIDQAETTMKLFSEAVIPGTYAVDTFPFLKYVLPSWLPGVKFWKVGYKGRDMVKEMVTRPYEYTKQQIAQGTARSSFLQDILSQKGLKSSISTDQFEHECKWAAGSMFAGGEETVTTTITLFIMLMALNPDKQRKAREELFRVIGEDRLPTIQDKPALPYLNAVIKETMRWQPLNPLSLPRRTTEDSVYNGYFIPAETVIIPNVWAVTLETGDDQDPKAFIPERFIEGEGKTLDSANYIFGFGRRICPGRFLADNSIFIMFATILAGFEISLAKDPASGKEIPIVPKILSGFISFPAPFECDIRPLSTSKAGIIRARAAAAED